MLNVVYILCLTVVSVVCIRDHNAKLTNKTAKTPFAAFPCEILPPSSKVPTSVHELKPGDIKVVAALGDSITAGNGIDAEQITETLIEYRGLSWSIGGDEEYESHITLPNILKNYNTKLYGFSTGKGSYKLPSSHFNVARPGVTAVELGNEASDLISKMKKDKKVNIKNDWKLITLFIGGNDICDYCNSEMKYSSKNYTEHLRDTLDLLRKELPRSLVNFVPVINMTFLRDISGKLVCKITHSHYCNCVVSPKSNQLNETNRAISEYWDRIKQLISSGRYDKTDDFTVVFQPFTLHTSVPKKADGKTDYSFMAPDCFHLSRNGHSVFARSLWNNMVQPIGQKDEMATFSDTLRCPTQDQPYIYTSKNSKR